MQIYILHTTDPYINLATEEYLLTHKKGDVMMLWRNCPTVVIGCNQSLLREIDISYLEEKKINIIRRISGGGAVYHDLGNINFSILTDYIEGKFCDFSFFCSPVVAYLQSIGVPAALGGRNDMLIDGAKFSGNAQAVRKDRLLHHGTLLFDTDLTVLSKALTPDPLKLSGKGISSVRSRVTNIHPHIPVKITPDQFMENLSIHFTNTPNCKETVLTEAELQEIELLAQNKYRTFDWLYGRSPEYTFTNTKRFAFGGVTLFLRAENGKIVSMQLCGDFFGKLPAQELCDMLVGCPHTPESLRDVLKTIEIENYIAGATSEDVYSLFF